MCFFMLPQTITSLERPIPKYFKAEHLEEVVAVHPSTAGMHLGVQLFDHAPLVFKELRSRAHIDVNDYLNSWAPPIVRKEQRISKSKRRLCRSFDQKYLVKQLSQGEFMLMKKMLPDYLEHIVQNPSTLLCRVTGLFNLTSGKKSVFIMVQRCGFSGSDVREIYDVSGKDGTSELVKPKAVEIKDPKVHSSQASICGAFESELPPVQRDLELQKKILLGSSSAVCLMKQLRSDLGFLFQQGLSEYSLLIGVKPLSKEAIPAGCTNLKNTAKALTLEDAPSSAAEPSASVPASSSTSSSMSTLPSSSPLPSALRKKTPYTPSSKVISAPRMVFFVETHMSAKKVQKKKKKKPIRKKRSALEPSAGSQSGGYVHALSSTRQLGDLADEAMPSFPQAYPCSALHCLGGGLVGRAPDSAPPSAKKLKSISLKLDPMTASENDALTTEQRLKQLNRCRIQQLENPTSPAPTEGQHASTSEVSSSSGTSSTSGATSLELYSFVLVDFLQGPLQTKVKKKLFRSAKKSPVLDQGEYAQQLFRRVRESLIE